MATKFYAFKPTDFEPLDTKDYPVSFVYKTQSTISKTDEIGQQIPNEVQVFVIVEYDETDTTFETSAENNNGTQFNGSGDMESTLDAMMV